MTGVVDIPTIRRHNKCRTCGGGKPMEFLTLENIPMPEGHVPPERFGEEFLMELPLFWCPACLMVQTQHDLDLSNYYKNYHFNVSSSDLVRTYMQSFSRALWDRFDLTAGDVVIDIGSGDGFQLSCFRDLGARVIGIEPSSSLANVSRSNGIPVVEELFDPARENQLPQELKNAKVVCSQYS